MNETFVFVMISMAIVYICLLLGSIADERKQSKNFIRAIDESIISSYENLIMNKKGYVEFSLKHFENIGQTSDNNDMVRRFFVALDRVNNRKKLDA